MVPIPPIPGNFYNFFIMLADYKLTKINIILFSRAYIYIKQLTITILLLMYFYILVDSNIVLTQK